MPPLHPATGRWTRAGIFDIDDVDSWLDIEERITQIELPLDRGNAMEIFVEALLNTHPIFQTTEVYPNCEGTIPEHVSELLNLSGDYGVDGVYHGTDQIFDAYQSKFRSPTGQPIILNWGPQDDLSHLFADGEMCRSKLVISNADDVVSRVRRQNGVHLFLRDDFLALSQDDIIAALSFIHNRPVKRSRFTPLPHQADALNDLHPIIWEDSCGQLIMPPGAGKTLVGLWACEQYFDDLRNRGGSETQVAVVFEPSLALVKQVLEQPVTSSPRGVMSLIEDAKIKLEPSNVENFECFFNHLNRLIGRHEEVESFRFLYESSHIFWVCNYTTGKILWRDIPNV